MNLNSLTELIDFNNWNDIPDRLISREGHPVDSSGEIWHLPIPIKKHASIDFSKIANEGIRWATKRYIQDLLEFTSSIYAYTVFVEIWRQLLRLQNDFSIIEGVGKNEVAERLISLFESAISKSRKKHTLWEMYQPIEWYVWCAENYPEIGFCPAYALELDCMTIPGGPKGEAVRTEDIDSGPLHRSLELPLLIKALRMDKSTEFAHFQERAVLALSIALGRNPANLTYLKEKDLVNLTPESEEPTWVINMPRIKKSLLNPRDDMLQEFLDAEFAQYLLELIDANRPVQTIVNVNGKYLELDRPLFINRRGNRSAIISKLIDSSFNMTSEGITGCLKSFVKRHKIISPLTNEILNITVRRLRYTLGTALAAEGISKKELARILDHTDTQHVQVYFELAGSIVEHLDKAAAKGFSQYLKLFRGQIIDSDSEAINLNSNNKQLLFIDESAPTELTNIGVCGKESICHLDPPFSCYLCEKFQPYSFANHEHVLDCLLQGRKTRLEKYESSRLSIQLDDVIFAVAQVVEECRLRANHG
jgi:integrase